MNNSSVLFEQAQKIIPGGVNSPVRAFKNVGGNPIFIASAHGAYLSDVDNKEYIDYVGSWGPMILGHNHSVIRNAVIAAVKNGLSFGAPTKDEVTLAQIINHLMPSIEQVRMVNSGTEATMSAIRLARGYTGRDKIIKFAGCYHGHADSLLVQAGSGALTFGQPSSPGVPDDFAKHTLVCRYNDLDSVTAMLAKYPNEIAAIIVEPVAGNMNCVPPQPGFLDGLRSLCDQNKSLLIFDEVMTGFRVALGGAQSLYNIKPDLTTLGKIIGGGMPVGAFGGKAEIMAQLAPLGPIYQAGTLSGNPIAMAAGIACLKELAKEGNAETLSQNMQKLVAGMQESAKRHKIDLVVNHVGAMFGFLFNPLKQVTCYEDVAKSNTELFNQFFHLMLKQGIYLAPSTFEAGFISLAHSELEINATIKACDNAFKEMAAIDKQP